MSSRRVPLSNIPNATNSPYRAASTAATKRSRSHSSIQRELPYGQHPPPAKRHVQESDLGRPQASHHRLGQIAEGRVFDQPSGDAQLTVFGKKLLAARERQSKQKVSRAEETTKDGAVGVRQWQQYYRKVFPHYVFYFESIPEDVRAKCSKQVHSLGAKEEKFFSKAITHVITTRSIPTTQDHGAAAELQRPSCVPSDESTHAQQPTTINPLLLERSSEPTQAQMALQMPKGKYGHDSRRQPTVNADVLLKAKEMGMKIWALEKLQRMMVTMFDTEPAGQSQHGHNTRSNATVNPAASLNRTREANLSELLRHERLNGPSDRDPTVSSKQTVQFRGPFIYIHDIDETTRPIMVREYSKVAHKEDGSWPQFRSVGHGRCPFVEEASHSRKERGREQEARVKREEQRTAPRTRAAAAMEAAAPPQAARAEPPRALAEKGPNHHGVAPVAQMVPRSKLFEPPAKVIPAKRGSPEKMFGPSHNQHIGHGDKTSRLVRGEPIASGVQQSNLTSAIRSQMISSTAAAPGAKSGLSKEVYELHRKVLEKNSGPTTGGIPSSHHTTDFAGIERNGPDRCDDRPTRRAGQAKMTCINEGLSRSKREDHARHLKAAGRSKNAPPTVWKQKEPTPGYCENCREKFEDFDEHTLSRKHRKFAINNANWSELDDLLVQLDRPLRL
ncbi:MAG: hypothetical protein M1817_003202 [Caeruleum heppii]|nr:MAG: hypothetical protein M1817_003202 [Caeruleum heppii]